MSDDGIDVLSVPTTQWWREVTAHRKNFSSTQRASLAWDGENTEHWLEFFNANRQRDGSSPAHSSRCNRIGVIKAIVDAGWDAWSKEEGIGVITRDHMDRPLC
jgi:hypothetical protein